MAGTTPSAAPLTMEQKEAAWTAWWSQRPHGRDDGSQSVWVKEQAVLREKKAWWLRSYGEAYWTREDKELQWRNYWESAHGEGSEPLDGHEKALWWRQTFAEEYVRPLRAQIAAMRSVALRRAQLAAESENP